MNHSAYLTSAHRFVFFWLLERADNADCAIPVQMAPSVKAIAAGTQLSERTVFEALKHLERHGWLARQSGGGRGRRNRYRLVPGTPDPTCSCEKVQPARPLAPRKGASAAPFSAKKGATSALQTVQPRFTRPPEILAQTALATKGHEGGRNRDATANTCEPRSVTEPANMCGGRVQAGSDDTPGEKCQVGGCTRPVRCGLHTCALPEHMAREIGYQTRSSS